MSDTNITIPLECYLNTVLHDKHYAPISPLEAEVIKLKTGNKHTAYIQEIDYESGKKLPQPLVWRHHVYLQTTDRWLENKRRSEREREERFIYDANVNKLAKAVTRETGLVGDVARVMAHSAIKNKKFNLIKNFYKVTLITKVEEIPN